MDVHQPQCYMLNRFSFLDFQGNFSILELTLPGVMAQNVICHGESSKWAYYYCIMLLFEEGFCKYHLDHINDSVINASYILTIFLLAWSINYWKQSFGVSSCKSGFVFSFQFCQFGSICFEVWLLYLCTWKVVISFLRIDPFI